MATHSVAVGSNVSLTVSEDGKKLTIEIDLTRDLGPSASGKTRLVASTQGNAEVPGQPTMRLGLNLYRKP
jgi:hypothetical protein